MILKEDLVETLEGLFFKGQRSKFWHFWFVRPFSQKLTSIFMSRPVDRRDIMFPGCPSFRPSVRHALGVPLCVHAAPSKSYAFSTNYHACIAMPTWPRCAPPILRWPWPPYNLFPRSCLTWIFFVHPNWWVPLCVQRPAKAMPFQQMIMHALQCQHDLDVHLLFCDDLDLHITSSRGRV